MFKTTQTYVVKVPGNWSDEAPVLYADYSSDGNKRSIHAFASPKDFIESAFGFLLPVITDELADKQLYPELRITLVVEHDQKDE